VQGDGRIHELSAAAGADELWWGVRGAGNSLGLVLEATFQAHLLPCGGIDMLAAEERRGRTAGDDDDDTPATAAAAAPRAMAGVAAVLWVQRQVELLDAGLLARAWEAAAQLPHHASLSLFLGLEGHHHHGLNSSRSVAMLYFACTAVESEKLAAGPAGAGADAGLGRGSSCRDIGDRALDGVAAAAATASTTPSPLMLSPPPPPPPPPLAAQLRHRSGGWYRYGVQDDGDGGAPAPSFSAWLRHRRTHNAEPPPPPPPPPAGRRGYHRWHQVGVFLAPVVDGVDGRTMGASSSSSSSASSSSSSSSSASWRARLAPVSAQLQRLLSPAAAPSLKVRVDLQHSGGAVAATAPNATAFWPRQ
jgi:hypothetical protein